MNLFTTCQHCSQQIHESAIACPKCGAPTTKPTMSNSEANFTTYEQVPWYRKRWFAIVSLILCWPLFGILLLTGDFYLPKNGEVKTIPKKGAYIALVCMVIMVIMNTIKG